MQPWRDTHATMAPPNPSSPRQSTAVPRSKGRVEAPPTPGHSRCTNYKFILLFVLASICQHNLLISVEFETTFLFVIY